ncbi:electron transfer flavoprotein alpha [Actinidia rufa]|uniref:Electron transfer flavoprotein alpha n=1 Tax=Actinidia rufa TaxID=165716 RepID=A0A7J0D7U7_9ERIC|nr:electron transfer flavoprotein alpha [Actinidia rufa]
MMTIRSTSFPVAPISDNARSDAAPIFQVDLSAFDEDAIGKSRYIKQSSQNTEWQDLGNARVVVTGGQGLKSADNFKMIEKLAEKLGAAVGAIRAAVDAGFVPNDLQVVKLERLLPQNCILLWVFLEPFSTLTGMRDTKVIVAVNKDADAPIFQVADYRLVGDLFEAIPELIQLPEKKWICYFYTKLLDSVSC